MTSWVGQSIERVEDAALLTGRGRYIDDIAEPTGCLHAAVLRSPHPHAVIRAIEANAARAAKGVAAVVTGIDVTRLGAPLLAGVKANIQCWPIAVGKVRYVGEPVAVVVAADRYLAEDALELIEVDYAPLPITLRPADALKPDSAVLHEGLGGNIASDRSFRYGDPEAAFAAATHRVSVKVDYPRNSCTPIETYGLIADYDPGEDAYDVLATFQGPFSIHAVLSRALKVPGNRLRLRTPPDSGGSFGVKQGIFPYIALMAIAARVAGRPVKWIEDRLEHLTASVSATNRLITLEAAVEADGRITALAWDQVEDVGAHIRAPEPATLYRMHGNLTGAYDIPNVSVRNRVVITNKTPTGLNRGFGGPQVYYALERLMQRVAAELKLDPLDVIRRNLVPSGAFPFRTATGGLLELGRLSGLRGASDRRRRPRRIARAAKTGARGGPSLWHRAHRRGRAERLEHGLHHHRAHARGAAQGRSEERRAGDRDHFARSRRCGVGACLVRSAGAGTSHRGVADRRRCARADAVGHSREHRDGHRARRLVDRQRQLREPLRPGGVRRRAACGGTLARQARARRRRAT